ncbi:MAG: hypothetical protein EYC70_07920 [Planctomycetota bacterium]|nr:MAG: hypothetical protein EYC70_07920 [Planctomycetota bacterium]
MHALLATALLAAQSYTITDLGTLGGGSNAFGGSELGHACGQSYTSQGEQRAVWSDGTALVNLGTLPGGAFSMAYAVNESDVVVGASGIASGNHHAFRWQAGVMEDIGTLPGGALSLALDVNSNGEVAGWSSVASGASHAFLYARGVLHDLGTLPGGRFSEGHAVNNRRQVAGLSETASGAKHACLWTYGVPRDLGVLGGGSTSVGTALNELGHVTGWSAANTIGIGTAFLWDGVMRDLGTLSGGTMSQGFGINEKDEVVGWSTDAGGRKCAVRWLFGQVTDLNTLLPPGSNWELYEAWDINDAGDIVGWGYHNGQERAFRMQPDGLRLRGPSPGLTQEQNSFVVSGAPPRSRVFLAYGTQSGFTAVPGCGSLSVDIQGALLLGTADAGASGNALFALRVPATFAGLPLYVQAVVPSTCDKTNTVVHVFP